MQELLQGLVIRSQAGWMTVRTSQGDYACRVRGRLRRGRAEGDLVAVGDQVMVAPPQADGTGRIDEILPPAIACSRGNFLASTMIISKSF